MIRPDLRLGRLVAVWAPLAATFLLVTGSTPVVNAAINRLPGRDHKLDLAAFAVFLSCLIVLHSPLFVTREIAIRLSVDRAGSRRALLFCVVSGAVVGLVELLLGATPLGAHVLGAFADDPRLIAHAHRAFLYVWPVPVLIAVRGVYQAHQIRVDDTMFVGLGTLVRIGSTALLGFMVAPRIGWDGPMLGALCIAAGVAIETVFAVVRARRAARPPKTSDTAVPDPVKFGLPLMFANFLGVAASLFYLKIAGLVPAGVQKASLAAFQEVKPLHWLFGAGAFAFQSLTTAKVRAPEDVRPMLRFSLLIGGALSAALAVVAFTPVRDWVLVDLMGEAPDGDVMRFATPALMLASVMPFLTGLRFCLRGILIANGRSKPITLVNLGVLAILGAAVSFGLLPFENGALNAYVLWSSVMCLELVFLWRAVRSDRPDPGALPPPLRTPRESTAG